MREDQAAGAHGDVSGPAEPPGNCDTPASRSDSGVCNQVQYDDLLEAFEQAWWRGERPSIEAYLRGEGPDRTRLLAELLHTDMEFRLKASEPARVENYLGRFDEIGKNSELLLELLQWEYRVRRRLEPNLQILEYQERFPDLVGRLNLLEEGDTFLYDGPRQRLPANCELGNYLIIKLIGFGGMGQVYQALHQRMGRLVALKILSSRIANDPMSLERFFHEVKVLAKLTHPNIVTAYDADEIKDMPFYVMEYVEGVDLSRLVRKHGPLSIRSVLECTLQAAEGLRYAHKQGVIHRDIKPSNLLLSHEGVVKILDLGLARFRPGFTDQVDIGGLTFSGAVMGTPDFMSPEQALDSKTADQRSDIYSLGCTLFFLLTGRPPYVDGTAMQRLIAHREQPVPPIQKLRGDLPQAVVAVVRKMLAKQPGDRYQSMGEVAEELRACVTRMVKERSLNDVASDVARHSSMDIPRPNEFGLNTTMKLNERSSFWKSSRHLIWGAAFTLVAIATGLFLLRSNEQGPAEVDSLETAITTPLDEGKPLQAAKLQSGLVVGGNSATALIPNQPEPATSVSGVKDAAASPQLSNGALPPVLDVKIADLPTMWPVGPREDVLPGYVARPAKLPGIRRWQLESRWPDMAIQRISVNADGLVAVAGVSDTVRIMKLQPPSLERLLVGHSAVVTDAMWQPVVDGKLATVDAVGNIRLWSREGQLLKSWDSELGGAERLIWNHRGTLFVTVGRAEKLKVWTAEGEPWSTIADVPSHPVVSWGPGDGQLTLKDQSNAIIVVQDDGKDRSVWPGRHELGVSSLAWDTAGQCLVTLDTQGGVRFWNRTGELVKSLQSSPVATAGPFWRPDGQLVVTMCKTGIQFWTPQGEPALAELNIYPQDVSSIAWGPTGAEFAISSFYGEYSLRKYNGTASQILATAEKLKSGWASLDVAPVSGRLLTSNYTSVTHWSPDGKRILPPRAGKPATSPFSAVFQRGEDGFIVGGYYFGDQGQNLELQRADGALKTVCLTPYVRALATNPRTGQVASAGPSGKIHIWSPEGSLERELSGHTSTVDSLAWSPDGEMLASFGQDHYVRLWPQGEVAGPVLSAKTYGDVGSNCLAWNRAGLLACGGEQLQVWNSSGELQWTSKVAKRTQSVAWRPDGQILAALEWPDTSLNGSNTNGRLLLLTFQGELACPPRDCREPGRVAWSANGTNLYVCRTLSTFNGAMSCQDAMTGDSVWTVVHTDLDGSFTLTAAGQVYDAVPGLAHFDRRFVYLVEELDGRQRLVEPSEFRKRFPQSVAPGLIRTPESTLGVDRDVAQWALAKGARIRVRQPAVGFLDVNDVAALPTWDYILEWVDFNGVKGLTAADLRRLQACRNLATVTFSNCPDLTDEAIRELTKISSLNRLGLSGTQVRDTTTVRLLEHFSRLNAFDVSNTKITDAAFDLIIPPPDLGFLFLAGTQLTDSGMAQLSKIKAVHNLSLANVQLTAKGFELLAPMSNLATLSVPGEKLGTSALSAACQLKSIHHMELNTDVLTDEGIEVLERATHIHGLSFVGDIEEERLAQLARLTSLRTLKCEGHPRVTGRLFSAWKSMPQLVELTFWYVPITDEGLQAIAELPHLRTLKLVNPTVTAEGVRRFREMRPNCVLTVN